MNRPEPRCDVPTGSHQPPIRPFACGPRCALHTPAAIAGKPEAPTPKEER